MSNYLKVGANQVAGNQVIIAQLTPADVLNKFVILPISGNSSMIVMYNNIIKQNIGHDIALNGNILSWDGYGLETSIEAGETFFIYP